MRAKNLGSRRGFVALALIAVSGLLFSTDVASAQTGTNTGYTVPTVGHVNGNQAGVIFDNTTPTDWTGHLTAGGFGSRVVPKVTNWFALPTCDSNSQLYCVSMVSLGGVALQRLPSPTAVDNNPLARSSSDIKTGIVTRWSSMDGKTLIAVNSYATFRCELNCSRPDVSQVAADVRAYKVAKAASYQPLGYWDVYSALMGGHPEDQQLFRDCAWLDKGACGKIVALPAKEISLTLQLPVSLRTAFAGPDVLTSHVDNVYVTEATLGANPASSTTSVRAVTVTGTPATVAYFAGVLNPPLPNWAGEGRTTILNPEDGNSLPLTSNGAPTGANQVWQFALNEAASGNTNGSCLAAVHGTVVAIGSDSSRIGAFDWVATTQARFSTQDYPRNLNLSERQVQVRTMMRNDFASCMGANLPGKPQKLVVKAAFQLGTTDSTVTFSQYLDSSNATWLIKDLVYPAQVPNEIAITLDLSSGSTAITSDARPKAVVIPAQRYSILCSKKIAGSTYTAKATGTKPKCPAGYKLLGFAPTN